MRAAFRVDASPTIGLGHLMRCLNLADALRARGAECTFASAYETGAGIVRASGHAVARLDVDAASRDDARAFAQLAAGSGARGALAILDGYTFDVEYMRLVRASGVCTCVLDDVGDRAIDADAVLNGNFHGAELAYAGLPPECVRLLGPAYGIVGDAFVEARAQREAPKSEARRLLVIMGGADPTRETEKALRALAHVPAPLDVRVVVGPANPYAEAIAKEAAASSHAVTVVHAPKDVAAEMLACDVALTAAGTTAMELATVTVPAIAVAVADNQRQVADAVARRGLMWSAGWHGDVDEVALAKPLATLLADHAARVAMVNAQRSALDGRGKERVAEALIHAAKEKT